MPRQSGTSIQNKFIKGLITEATALSFPEDACTETSNCVFDYTGRVTRRPGIDMETGFEGTNLTATDSSAYAEFVWNAAAGDGNISFVVIQADAQIFIYNTSSGDAVSPNIVDTFSLNLFRAEENVLDPADFTCQFAAGNGDLFITNPACDPIFIVYDSTTATFDVNSLTLQVRDFEGLDDGLAVDTRPTDNVSGSTNPNHIYNLINQGWGLTDALTQWDAARTDLPSNADYFELYRGSATDAFDNSHVTANDPGNRLAPQGHFVLTVPSFDRQSVFEAEAYTDTTGLITTSPSFSLIDRTAGSIIGDFTINAASAFDGVTDVNSIIGPIAGKLSTTSAYIGKDFGSSPKTFSRAIIWPSNDQGFLSTGTRQLRIYGSNVLPANATDGTLLADTGSGISDDLGSVTLTSTNTTTQYRYLWLTVNSSTTASIVVAEVIWYTAGFAYQRPSCVEFYAGRVFYAGIASSTLSNDIYFSQIIESRSQYAQCYQKNDPTSSIPDLLPDDGGVIKIPDMGSVRKLYAYQSALLVFASNGIWLIQGSTGSNFKATDYIVKRISSVGMNAPQSLISIRGLPAWWGDDGIYTVTFDPNYDSFTPQSLSINVIDSFYQAIPLNNKTYVKGAYDEVGQIAYWLFSDEDLVTDFYKYNRVLVMDARSKAFYPWELTEGATVRSIVYVKPALKTTDAKIKLFVYTSYDGASAISTFADFKFDQFKDWNSIGAMTYESSFVTGYKLDGKTQYFFQPSYIFVFLETQEDSSCFVQPIFDFTNDSSTGKWGTAQQIYNNGLLSRNINFRRLKMRGTGRALQLKFTSEEDNPFNIIGWSIYETTNSSI